MKKQIRITFLFTTILCNTLFSTYQAKNENWIKRESPNFVLNYSSVDSTKLNSIVELINLGIDKIKEYFGRSYKNKFNVFLFPTREKLDKQWGDDWKIPNFKSECWMVASGTGNRLDILSPRVWKSESCEHDAEDSNHLREIINHELAHVFHGQHNLHSDFSGMDEISWFVEGLAVLVAGQLNKEKLEQLKEAYRENKLPLELKNGWSGKYRYSVSGSMVKFIEEKWGKEKIFFLLKMTSEKEILNELKFSENNFLYEWKNWLNKIIEETRF